MLRVSLCLASPICRLSHSRRSQESEMINYLQDFVEICKILWVYFDYGIGKKTAKQSRFLYILSDIWYNQRFIVNAALSQQKDDLIALHKNVFRRCLEKKFQKNIINLENKTTFTGKKMRCVAIISTLIVKCFSYFFVFDLVCLRVYICISLSIVIVFFSIIEFDLNESRLSRSSQRTSKYAPNMREPKIRTKNFRKATWHLRCFVSHWSARRSRRQRQQIPKTGRRRCRRRHRHRRSSFVVPRLSFVSLFIVASCRVRARTHARAVSWPRRVLGAQHDCRNGKQPALTQLSPPATPHTATPRGTCTSLACARSRWLPRLAALALDDIFNAKQAAVKRMFVVFSCLFGGCSSSIGDSATERLQCCPTSRRAAANNGTLPKRVRSFNDSRNGKQISEARRGRGSRDY